MGMRIRLIQLHLSAISRSSMERACWYVTRTCLVLAYDNNKSPSTIMSTVQECRSCWIIIYDHHNQLTTFPMELTHADKTHHKHERVRWRGRCRRRRRRRRRRRPLVRPPICAFDTLLGSMLHTLSTVLHEFPPATDDTHIHSSTTYGMYVCVLSSGCCRLPLKLCEIHRVGVTLRFDRIAVVVTVTVTPPTTTTTKRMSVPSSSFMLECLWSCRACMYS